MRTAGEARRISSRASRSSDSTQLQIGSGVLHRSAFRCLPGCTRTQSAPTYTLDVARTVTGTQIVRQTGVLGREKG